MAYTWIIYLRFVDMSQKLDEIHTRQYTRLYLAAFRLDSEKDEAENSDRVSGLVPSSVRSERLILPVLDVRDRSWSASA